MSYVNNNLLRLHPARMGGDKVGESSAAAKEETLLYVAGFVIGVGGVLAGLAVGLGLLDNPFPDNGGVVTPAGLPSKLLFA
jgi:hypothetical protein